MAYKNRDILSMYKFFDKIKGFTLIELMITLTIIGILAAIAIPSYTGYITKSRRTDGQVALLDLAASLERYFIDNNTYATATLPAVHASTSPKGHYNLSIPSKTATSYTIQATPTGAQTDDTACASLTLTSLGEKSATGSISDKSQCW